MDLREIRTRLKSAAQPPLQARLETINGVILPVSIEGSERTIVSVDRGLLCDNDIDAIRAEADFIINARIDIDVLLRALLMACAGDESHANFLVGHAHKEVLIELGLAPEEKIFKQVSKDV